MRSDIPNEFRDNEWSQFVVSLIRWGGAGTDLTWVPAPAFEVAHSATELANASTPKAFHNKAQRRAAHAGSTKNASGKPQQGFTAFVVKPRWGFVSWAVRIPGCAARPWAKLCNRFAVREMRNFKDSSFVTRRNAFLHPAVDDYRKRPAEKPSALLE